MSMSFSSTDFTTECKRGPHLFEDPCVLSMESVFADNHVEEINSQEMGYKVERGGAPCDQHSERVREREFAERRRVAAGIAQDVSSQLLAELPEVSGTRIEVWLDKRCFEFVSCGSLCTTQQLAIRRVLK